MKIKSISGLGFAAAIALGLTVSGCATKRYGRMTQIVPAEAAAYDCKQLGIEVAKVEGFEAQVAEGAKVDWKSVAGFLGDYGIGNAMEKDAALKSASDRKMQLRKLQSEKGCAVN